MAKTWFITGTSRGFGREWAIAALERGDSVAATARDTATPRRPRRSSTATRSCRSRSTSPTATRSSPRWRGAHEHFGRLDVVVNNAGYGQFGMVEELSEAEARDQIETNLFGALWVTQAALPFLREQGCGHILQVSSIGGICAFPNIGIYHASKWALEGIQPGAGPGGRRLRHQGHARSSPPASPPTGPAPRPGTRPPTRPTTGSARRPRAARQPARHPGRPGRHPRRGAEGRRRRGAAAARSSSATARWRSPPRTTSRGWPPGASGSRSPSRPTARGLTPAHRAADPAARCADADPAADVLAGWTSAPFTAAGVTHDVYTRGSGPGVVLLPEIPGMTPQVMGLGEPPRRRRVHGRRPVVVRRTRKAALRRYAMRTTSRRRASPVSSRRSPATPTGRSPSTYERLARHLHGAGRREGGGRDRHVLQRRVRARLRRRTGRPRARSAASRRCRSRRAAATSATPSGCPRASRR